MTEAWHTQPKGDACLTRLVSLLNQLLLMVADGPYVSKILKSNWPKQAVTFKTDSASRTMQTQHDRRYGSYLLGGNAG